MQKQNWLMIAGFVAVSLLSSCGSEKKETNHQAMHDEEDDRVAQVAVEGQNVDVVAHVDENIASDDAMHVAHSDEIVAHDIVEADDHKA